MIDSLVNKWFYPFNRIFEIAVVSEDIAYCDKFSKMLCSFFNDNNLKTLGISGLYIEDQNIFQLLIQDTTLKFRLTAKVFSLSEEPEEFKSIEGDILIFITSFEKYSEHDFYTVTKGTDRLMCNIPHIHKVILIYMGTEIITINAVQDESNWHDLITPVYGMLMNNKNLKLNYFTGYGCQQIENLSEIMNYYSGINPFFEGEITGNFLYSDTNSAQIQFGQFEFMCNLIYCLMSNDKLNNYKYLIKTTNEN